MPLVGFLQTNDPGRISSITNVQGDLTRRKKIIPIPVHVSNIFTEMYVVDCVSHEPMGSVVPVEIMERGPVGWDLVGVAKCCPLCWAILVPPVGVDFPEAKPLEIPEKDSKYDGVRSRLLTSTRKGRGTEHSAAVKYNAVNKLLRERGSVTIQDVMQLLSLTRTGAKYYLEKALSRGIATKTVSSGGPSHKTVYSHRKAP